MSISLVQTAERRITGRQLRWGALALIVTAQFMVILDVAIVNVALPSIKSDLGFSQESLQWVVSAYAIFFGGALLLGGRLGDLLGRRRLFVAGLAVFGASSLLCGLAWSEASLITFRALQGLGGAMLAPAALALLITTFAEGRERNVALGIYGAAAGSGAAVGVLLGGVLTSYLSWPWIFFVNVPVAVAAIALTPLLLRESRAENALRHFDVAGATSITAGLMILVYALTRATTDGWATATTIGLLAASAVLVLSFIAIELRSKAPLLPLRIFRIRSLAAANAAMVIIGSVTFSEFFLLTLYLQDILHYSAIQTGVAFSGFAISVVVASNLAQAVVSRFGIRATLTAGILASALSVAWLTRLPLDGHYFWDMFPAFVLGGARPRLLVRAAHDREPRGRRACRCGDRLGPRQHEPPDRRSDRSRRDERDRRNVDRQLRRCSPRGRSGECSRARPRLPDHSLRAHGAPRRRCRHRRRLDQAAACCPGTGAPGRARRPEGGSMTSAVLNADTPALLNREIDDLLLQMRGLAVVRDILSSRGASSAEIMAHTQELESVRSRLTELISGT